MDHNYPVIDAFTLLGPAVRTLGHASDNAMVAHGVSFFASQEFMRDCPCTACLSVRVAFATWQTAQSVWHAHCSVGPTDMPELRDAYRRAMGILKPIPSDVPPGQPQYFGGE